MKVQHLFEGMWVVKNQDGKEKRFKDKDSAEAREWALSKRTAKVAAYSQAYWENKERASLSNSDIFPSTPIEPMQSDIEDLLEFNKTVDDYHVQKHGYEEFNGVKCATAVVRVHILFNSDEGDTPISDSVYIKIRRNEKTPKKLVLVKYI